MAVWSRVSYSEALSEDRFGAEFWKPEYLEPLKRDRNWHLIGDLLKGVQYGISREMNEIGIGEPIFRMNEMEDLFLSTPEKSVSLSKEEYDVFSLSPGDVLFNRTNSFKHVGRTGILKEPLRAVFASYLIRLIPDTRRLLPEYLAVYLNTPTGIAQIKRRAMESINQANVSGSEIRKVPIPLFPVPFQRSLASIVDKAAEKRTESKKIYAQAEQLLLSELGYRDLDLSPTLVYKRRFSETCTASRIDAEYFMPKYYRLLERIDQNRYTNVELSSLIAPIKNGFDSREFSEEGLPYIRVGDIKDGRIESENAKRIPIQWADVKKDIRLRVDDVLLTRKGSYGNAAFVRPGQEESVISSEIMLLRLKSKAIRPEYLTVYLNSPVGFNQVERHVHGVAFYSISQNDLAALRILLAPEKLQERIAKFVQNSDKARDESHHLLEEAKHMVEDAVIGNKGNPI